MAYDQLQRVLYRCRSINAAGIRMTRCSLVTVLPVSIRVCGVIIPWVAETIMDPTTQVACIDIQSSLRQDSARCLVLLALGLGLVLRMKNLSP